MRAERQEYRPSGSVIEGEIKQVYECGELVRIQRQGRIPRGSRQVRYRLVNSYSVDL